MNVYACTGSAYAAPPTSLYAACSSCSRRSIHRPSVPFTRLGRIPSTSRGCPPSRPSSGRRKTRRPRAATRPPSPRPSTTAARTRDTRRGPCPTPVPCTPCRTCCTPLGFHLRTRITSALLTTVGKTNNNNNNSRGSCREQVFR